MKNSDGTGHGLAPTGFKLSDLYYVLFRHKWKILFCSLLGIGAAAALFMNRHPQYSSEAKLLVRYLAESRPAEPGQVRMLDGGPDATINSEIEILSSQDLCEKVAQQIGPEKILAKIDGGNDLGHASSIIYKGLTIDPPRRSTVIKVHLAHPDPEIVQPALRTLIALYFERHKQTHRGAAEADTVLAQQADQARSRLAQVEEELRKLKTALGVTSLDDSKKSYAEELAKLRTELSSLKASLSEYQYVSKESEYRNATSTLERLRKRDLSSEEPTDARRYREQMEEAEKTKRQLEEQFPRLATLNLTHEAPFKGSPGDATKTRALEARIETLKELMEKVRAEAQAIDEKEITIAELQRAKQLEEKNYIYFKTSLEQAQFDSALGASKLSNITIVQAPTPPHEDSSSRLKPAIMAMLAGIFGGIAMAFLLEMFVDQTLKRPLEVETRLHMPLFYSIPRLAFNGKAKRAKAARGKGKGAAAANGAPDANGIVPSHAGPAAVWSESHPMHPYFEGLRDRTIMHFQGITRKPKLVGVTGCSKGAGVTSIAAGLAAALSETGDGKVLLMDLNMDRQAVHPFFRGKPGCGLAEILENDKREIGMVSDNLYLATATGENGHGSPVLPKRLCNIMPKLKASDFDYIVVDMPLLSQTSITPRLAEMVDLVLLVIESEKEPRDILKRAAAMLSTSQTRVGAVVNKFHNYVPNWLTKEL